MSGVVIGLLARPIRFQHRGVLPQRMRQLLGVIGGLSGDQLSDRKHPSTPPHHLMQFRMSGSLGRSEMGEGHADSSDAGLVGIEQSWANRIAVGRHRRCEHSNSVIY